MSRGCLPGGCCVLAGIELLFPAMIDHGFKDLSFERIEASTDAENLASSKVMERAGMSFWKRETTNGLDTVYFSISRDDKTSKT